MNITIKVIPNGEHRDGISGADWFWDTNGDLQVRVSKMSDWRYETILALHEASEAILCKFNGVTQKSVDDFDIPYHKQHPHDDCDAGDEIGAPYRREHCFATAIERILAAEMNVSWNDYDSELSAL